MDFVVSKVALSICALLVVSVLGGVLGDNALFRNAEELDSILLDLSTTLETSATSCCELNIVWSVPFLSDGEKIGISIDDFTITARGDKGSASVNPACQPRTWLWTGSALNRSSLARLDAEAPCVQVHSGIGIEILTEIVSYENQETIFVFVSPAD